VVKLTTGSTKKKKSGVNAAGNYTKPTMRKSLVASVKASGRHVKLKWSPSNTKQKVEDTHHEGRKAL